MQYRNMGKWGLKLSEISIGSWMTDLNGLGAAETARQSIRAADDAGLGACRGKERVRAGEAPVSSEGPISPGSNSRMTPYSPS